MEGLTYHRLWDFEHLTVRVVEAASQSPGKLDMLQLILSDGHMGSSIHNKTSSGA